MSNVSYPPVVMTVSQNTESELTFHAARETPPVGKYDERQLFSVEVFDSLWGFVGGVWEPHLPCLLY